MICHTDGTLISPPIWADFQARDWESRIRLDLPGTRRDLEFHQITLRKGLGLVLFDEDADQLGLVDDIVALGFADLDDEEGRWVAVVDWDVVCHVSELTAEEAKAYRAFRPQATGEVR